MQIDILAKNIELDNPLRVFVHDKIGGLERILGNAMVNVRVEIGRSTRHHRTGLVFYAEANLRIGKTLLRAEAHHEDLRAAITEVKDDIQIQIKKFKEKNLATRKRKR